MPEEVKKDWEQFNINGIKSTYKLLSEILQNLHRFSTWMTTICLAALGFFITVLLQIKKEPILPNKYLAIAAMLVLVFSIVFGFYIRLRFETRESLLKLQRALKKISDTIASATEYEMTSEERRLHSIGMKAFSVLNGKLTEAKNSLLSPKFHVQIIIQGIALLIGIILSSSYMFWYIFII